MACFAILVIESENVQKCYKVKFKTLETPLKGH